MTDAAGTALGMAAARRLRNLGIVDIRPGLTAAELAAAEERFGFVFADDHRAFLAAGLPLLARGHCEHPDRASWGWPDWRDLGSEELRSQVDWPVDTVLEEIGAGHWPHGWGSRPADPAEALDEARSRLAEVPRMVPVYAHRYLPAGRGTSGHAVLSIHRLTDIIVYGANLAEYIGREFHDTWTAVPFWGDYV
ncbi:hypothetical protein [Catellatospora citrea]|uniref:Uncharacterized protein n=1 Tax=Catellatospora citrea TaxID=53366 RepID=A0A8J3P265_9ACTN|nr:hypothetical protein [Catellatospora citrea]RKE12248.1 hypothetical protein C8E86_7186 [Catellatospora citrea]GIG00753.1 hypothetical protein Cci01nite_58460 [Catellatospora citrea]